MTAPATPASGTAADGTAWDLHGGPQEAGSVVVLIHGLGLCRRLFDDHVAALAGHSTVLTYDLYGHGESAPAPVEASLKVYATQLASLLDELDIASACLVGFSIGGMINRRFVLDHPQRVAALAVLNSPHDRGPEAQTAVEVRARSVREQGALATMDAALARWFTAPFLEARPDWAERVRQWRLDAEPESYAQATWVLANGVRELIAPDPAIDVPTLVMTGENDTGSTPAMSHSIAAEIPNSTTIIVPTLQHLGLVEQPELFTEPLIAFLKGLPQ